MSIVGPVSGGGRFDSDGGRMISTGRDYGSAGCDIAATRSPRAPMPAQWQPVVASRRKEALMPAKTEKQRKFMGAELQRKREGKKTRTDMSESELEKMASKKKDT